MHRLPLGAMASAALLAAPMAAGAATPPLEAESFLVGTVGALC